QVRHMCSSWGMSQKQADTWMRCCTQQVPLPRDDHFRDAVFCQKLAKPRPRIEQVLNNPIREYPLQWKRLGKLHFHGIALRNMEAAVSRLIRILARVKESQNLSARVERRMQMSHHRGNKRFRYVIECRP